MADEHLSEDTWERLACFELSPEELAAARAHIAACPACAEVHEAVMAMTAEARTFDPSVPSMPTATVTRAPRWLLGLAAAAVVVIALTPWHWNSPSQPSSSSTSVLRSSETAVSIAITAPSAGGTLSADGFAWKPVDGADAYRVYVSAPDGRAVWTSRDVTSSSVGAPVDVPLPPGTYFWRVTALKAQEVIAASALSRFVVSPAK